jgi:hypothetical protein
MPMQILVLLIAKCKEDAEIYTCLQKKGLPTANLLLM